MGCGTVHNLFGHPMTFVLGVGGATLEIVKQHVENRGKSLPGQAPLPYREPSDCAAKSVHGVAGAATRPRLAQIAGLC
jgi:hypothetical protein